MFLSISLVFLVLYAGITNTETVSSPGDVNVVGMFEIFEPEMTQCGDTVKINSVMYAEAIRWYFKKINEDGGIPFTIGFEAHMTCQLDSLAAAEAVRLANRILQHPDNTTDVPLIAGVIGPEYSSESIAVSRVLSALAEDDRLPQVGFSATSVSLRDSRNYPNFLSVVPDDGIQTEALIQSMLELGWNRVAIVYEDTLLGREVATALGQQANTVDICIAMTSPIDVTNGVSVSTITEILNDIIYGVGDLSIVNGYVFFGSSSTAKVLFRAIDIRNDIQSAPIAMLTESIELDVNTFQDGPGNLFSKTQGTLAVSPPYRRVAEFQDHWISLFTNDTAYTRALAENPWLQHVERYINATCETQTCSFPDTIQRIFKAQPLYLQYAIFAAHALAVGITKVHEAYCSDTSGICEAMASAFKPRQVMDQLRGRQLDFTSDFDFGLTYLDGDTAEDVTLTLAGQSGALKSHPDYELFNFRKTDSLSQDFGFVQVGDLVDGDMLLETDAIRDYADGTTETTWPEVRRAQCGDNHNCAECVPRDLPERFVHIPGDVYVVGLVPVYDRSATEECASLRTINGYQLAEALKFAIEKVNEKSGIFSNSFNNAKVGLIVVNTCNNQVVAQRVIYELIKRGMPLQSGERLEVKSKIMGFVGDVGSSISIAIAEALTRLKFVQISFASTSPTLSDRSAYPYFLRVVTPDDAQANVLIDLVQKLEGQYIQILYSKGAYGEDGMAKVLEAAKENDICVAAEIEVEEENANYYKYYEQLRRNPEARIVIVFQRSHLVKPLMTVIVEQIASRGEFVFIGSEAWAKNADVLKEDTDQNLLGSFTVALELASNTELQTHVANLAPVGFNENPWARLYLETKLDCYFSNSFDKSRPNACADVPNFWTDPDFTLTPWAPAAYNAMVSLLIGAGRHLETECGNVASLCDGYTNNIDGLIDELKSVQLDLHGQGTRLPVFDDNGDGNVGYILYNIQRNPTNPQQLVYTRVGQYPLQGNPTFSADKVVSPTPGGVTSVCPSAQACSSCFRQPDDSANMVPVTKEEMDRSAVIALGVVLGIAIVIIIVLVIVIVRKSCTTPKEDPYIHPTALAGPEFERPHPVGSGYTTPTFREENFDYLKPEEINMADERV